MLNEAFSDYFARRENFLNRIDARLKLPFIIAAIFSCLLSPNAIVPGMVVLFVLVSLLTAKIPLRIILLRLAAPLGIAVTLFAIKIFFKSVNVGPLLIAKVLGASSLVLFLGMTTTVYKILRAAAWFRVPHTWVEVSLLTYRYIFILFEDAATIFFAQKVRLGYVNLTKGLSSVGVLAGSVIIRAYDQSIASYEAMRVRGYKGKMANLSSEEKFGATDVLAALIFAAILAALVAMNILLK